MKAKDLREKGIGEMNKLLGDKQDNLRKLRFDMATKQVQNKKEIAKEKKDIARILTLINESQK